MAQGAARADGLCRALAEQHDRRVQVTSVTIGLPVTDLSRARRWYEAVLEVARPDVEPVDGMVEYHVGGIWLQLGQSEESPGGSTVRIGVPDVHAERERLVGPGIGTGPVEVVEGLIACVAVPERCQRPRTSAATSFIGISRWRGSVGDSRNSAWRR